MLDPPRSVAICCTQKGDSRKRCPQFRPRLRVSDVAPPGTDRPGIGAATIHHEWRQGMHKRSIAAVLIAGSALVAGVLVAPTGAEAKPAPKAVPDTKPTWLGHAQHLGHAS